MLSIVARTPRSRRMRGPGPGVMGVIALTLSVVFGPTAQAQSPGVARFDWVSYSGVEAAPDGPASPDTFRNPILAGFHPDPSITRAGDDFYLINSTFGFYPGIPVFHSRDLVNWTQVGNVIDRPDMMPFTGLPLSGAGIYAPAIRFYDGLFYVITTCVGCGGNFIVTASDPAGPWSAPIWLPHIQGIDPSLFFDDDGRLYIVHQKAGEPKRYEGHSMVVATEVDPQTFGPRSDSIVLVDGGDPSAWNTNYLEGPHLYKVAGRYYLSAAGGGTGYYHQQLVYRSDRPLGGFEPNPDNPILTQFGLPDDRSNPVTATGHADMVQDQTGQWWAVFLGTRPYDLGAPPQDPGRFHTGRETFLLPVEWRNGWPVILEHGAALPPRVRRPDLPGDVAPELPTTGSFSWREEFDGQKLAPQWLFARTPRSAWWRIADGHLDIRARPDRIGHGGQPGFVGRRLQHMTATMETLVSVSALDAGDEAGLAAIQSDEFYYAFGLVKAPDGLVKAPDGAGVLWVRRRDGADDPKDGQILAQLRLPNLPADLQLRMTISRGHIRFEYRRPDGVYQVVLGNGDAAVLTTARANGFVGAVAGPYAQSNVVVAPLS